MATTQAGREITEAHRVAQVAAGQDTLLEAEATWHMLDPDNLDRSSAGWLAAMLLLVGNRYRYSQRLSVAYLAEFRQAELGTQSGPVVAPALVAPVTRGLLLGSGPISIKESIRDGMSLEQAVGIARSETTSLASLLAMNGGRSTIDRSSRQDRRAQRYRRVSDGNPCAFCGMLASRGYAYSESTAYFRAHGHCGCTGEPGYGEWRPTDLELEWADAYDEAARQAREAGEPIVSPTRRNGRDTVLWRMRRNRPDLFSDGVYPKAA